MWTHRIITAAFIAVLGTVSLSSPAVAAAGPANDQIAQREMIERLRDLAIAQGDVTRLQELATLEAELERLSRELRAASTAPAVTAPGRKATPRPAALAPAASRRSTIATARSQTARPVSTAPNGPIATNAAHPNLPTAAVGVRRAVTVRPSAPVAEGRGLSVTMIGRRTPPKPRPAPGVLAGGGFAATPAGPVPATQVTEVDADKLYDELRESIRRTDR